MSVTEPEDAVDIGNGTSVAVEGSTVAVFEDGVFAGYAHLLQPPH